MQTNCTVQYHGYYFDLLCAEKNRTKYPWWQLICVTLWLLGECCQETTRPQNRADVAPKMPKIAAKLKDLFFVGPQHMRNWSLPHCIILI